MNGNYLLRPLVFISLLTVFLSSCTASELPVEDILLGACPVTEPAWIKPPDDAAISGSPEESYYFVNEDRSIWASAWWTDQEANYPYAGEDGIKIGWFRPWGADLEISGQRIDSAAPPLETHIPCCYPTLFQATGLVFPTEGCWEITATAEDSILSFVVEVRGIE